MATSKKAGSSPLTVGVLALLLCAYIAIQAPRFQIAPWDCFASWRESDTYSMALNFCQYGMEPLRPQLNYDGVADNYAQLELQILPFLSALVFKLFHTTSWAVSRVISLLFFLGSAAYLYLLMRRFTGEVASLAGLACYLFLPLSMLTASSIQPESVALFFYCGAVYYLKCCQDTAKGGYMLGAAAMAAFGIMEKTPVAFIGLLFLYVFFAVFGKDVVKKPLFYGTGALALLPPALLILYTSNHSVFRFVDGIAGKHILTGEIFSLFTRRCLDFFHTMARDFFGWPAVVLALAGFALCFEKKHRFYLVWTLAFALECATIVAVIQFDYYLVFMLPVCAALVSLAVEELLQCKKPVAVVLCAAALLFTLALDRSNWHRTQVDGLIDRSGAFIAAHTEPGEGIAVADINPAYLNAANRRGYRANIKYYDYIPVGAEGETAYFISHGVTKFAMVNGAVYDDHDGAYRAYLDEHFPVVASCDYCTIYDLTGGAQR